MPIIRDSYLIIIQHNRDYSDQADAGDSAARTGLMAMAGSTLDKSLMPDFIVDRGVMTGNPDAFKYLVRHPYQPQWSHEAKTSRDQVLCFSAGVDEYMMDCRRTMFKYAQQGRVNEDILLPHHRLTLYKAADLGRTPLLVMLLGYPLMFLHILYLCFLCPPETEVNQTIAMLSRFDKWWMVLLNKLHYDLNKAIMSYFEGIPWRDQQEIGEMIVNYVNWRCQ